MLSVDAISPFANHPFHLYEGERLSDMVESIREHGVLVPVIVRLTVGGYEMLAGHNRQNAARLAGIKEIPAIVKKDLSDQDAYVYVIETNVIQRFFRSCVRLRRQQCWHCGMRRLPVRGDGMTLWKRLPG